MKKLVSCIAAPALVAAALLSVVSCNKDNPDPVVITIDVYTAGNEVDGASCTPVIYLDDKELYRLESGCEISGVARIGSDVIACGNNLSTGKPVFWKNGAVSNNATPNVGKIVKMVSDGTDYLCCGFVESEGENYGVIYKNGEEFYRHKDPSEFYAIDKGASGDYYVVGAFLDGVSLLRINSSDKTVSETTVITKEENYVPTDLCVGLYDICVSMLNRTAECDKACYWVSRYDNVVPLSLMESTAYCITIFNGNLVVGGSILPQEGSSHKAVQWVADNPYDFSYDCNPGDSFLVLLSSDGYNLFEAVQSPGQVQICCNGGLLCNIDCAKTFEANSWYIVRVN